MQQEFTIYKQDQVFGITYSAESAVMLATYFKCDKVTRLIDGKSDVIWMPYVKL